MVIFTLFFTLGIWLLQQQAALPDFDYAWLLTGVALLYPLHRGKQSSYFSPFIFRVAKTLLVAAFAFTLGFYHAAWTGERRLAISLPDAWQGRDIEISGVVAELPHSGERGLRFAFDVEKTLTPDISVPPHIYLSTYFDAKNPPPQVHAGERWRLTVRLKQPHGSSNPHASDFELWALENNVRATGYVNNRGINIRLDARADGLMYRIETWREAVRDKFIATLGSAPYTGVLTALAVGDQGSIPHAQWQIFSRTGITHLVSISGLHITMLSGLGYALVYWLWRCSTRLTLSLPARKAAAVAALLVATGYSLLAGFGVPAQRTMYMVGTVACALWLNRNFSLGQILSFALLGVLLPDPWAVLAPGFWLSFGAVALILYVTAHRLARSHWLREYLTVQWAMSIGLIPMLLALFGQISLISPIANAFAIPMVSLVVVPLTLLGAALPFEVPLWLAHIAMDIIMVILEWLNALPVAVWTQHAPPAWSIVIGMLGVLWMLAPAGFPGRALAPLLMLPMFINKPEMPEPDTLKAIVFDVGQGLSVAAITRQHALLYDTGPDFANEADSGNRILIPVLRSLGVRELDGIVISHDDIDHTGGTASVIQGMPVGWLATSEPISKLSTVPELQDKFTIESRPCRDGIHWNWDGVEFEILHPGPPPDKTRQHDNELSCVLRISIGDQHILLAGDIEKHSEQRLLNLHPDQLPASLLVVPHHGSASSSDAALIAAILPDYAVFTTGYRNRFGHPKPDIVQRYLDSGATLLRSDQDGAILIDMSRDGLKLERYRQTHRHYWTHMIN
jgi:competence protein ComEC